MNRKDVREQAMDMVGISGAASMGGFDPVRSANRCAEMAHRIVQMECMAHDTSLFVRQSRFTYEADAVSVDLATKLDTATYGSVIKIVGCGTLESDADISKTNWPVPMMPFKFGPKASSYGVNIPNGYVDPATGAPASFTGVMGSGSVWQYALQNGRFWLQPLTTTDLYIYCEWYPLMAFDSDDDLVLAGEVPFGESLVVYKMAELLAKEKGFLEKGMLAQALYDENAARLPSFIEKRPTNLGFLSFRHPDMG